MINEMKKAGTEDRPNLQNVTLVTQPSTTSFVFDEALLQQAATIRAICFNIAGAEGEGAVQETFIKLWQMADEITDATKMAIAVRKVATVQANRKLGELSRIGAMVSFDDRKTKLDERSLPYIVEDRETEISVREALALIPENNADVFILREIEGCDAEEAARILRITEAQQATRYTLALLQLKEVLVKGKTTFASLPQDTKPAFCNEIAA